MTQSLRCAIGAGQSCRRIAGAALLLLALVASPVLAQAPAPDDPYTATAQVDVTADTAPAARDKARLDGQRQALTAVIQRLSGNADTTRLAKIDNQRITDMVVSFAVADERMSAVRYQASLTYHFRAADVRRVMQNYGIAAAAQGGSIKPIVVLPIYRGGGAPVLWGDPNPWRQAWGEIAPGATLTVPFGDAGDLATIDAAGAEAGNPAALAAVATKNGADEVAVVEAVPRLQGGTTAGLDVTIRRFRQGQPAGSATRSIDANPGESATDLLRRTAGAVAADIAAGGKGAAPAAAYDQQGTVAATVAITSLGDWIRTRNQLAAIATIRQIALLSLNQQQAAIDIGYVGSLDQLKAGLAAAGLSLAGGNPQWRIEPAGTPPPGH